ncbi:hypothetical protein [Aquiflexum balticum]|uniref:hypothetical protein n=1 Tax=Aquiflexum balticum TaxID=280473 RepID=UPI0009FDC208|nr:hypothetical protein [Aquiflexum balticum]
MEDFKLFGWLMVVIGLAIRYVISRRRFYRRGLGGLQHFRSYERGVFITFIEWIFSLLAFLILLGGIVTLGLYYGNKYFEKKERQRKASQSELVYNGLKEDILPLPHSSEQAAWTGLRFSHLP